MQVTIHPSAVTGAISATPSKSHAQRAIAVAALTSGTSVLKGVGKSDDVIVAMQLATALGGFIEQDGDHVRVDGGHLWTSRDWHCGESGLCLRMFAAIAALRPLGVTLTGEGSLLNRPVGFIEESLRDMGVTVKSLHGRAPLYVKGPYAHDQLMTDASASSQFLTGMLIALPLMQPTTRITVPNLVSKPYVDLTLEVINHFGVEITHRDYSDFHVGKGHYRPADLEIEGDWSGMANILACGTIGGSVEIHGLKYPSVQADSIITEVLTGCGIELQIDTGCISLKKKKTYPAFDFDATDCPDLIPVLAALAAHAKGTSSISGVNRIRTKESNRALALETEFGKLGVDITLREDVLNITGGTVQGGAVDAHGDHRIVMSLASLALNAEGPVTISGAESVSKSYPGFFDDLQRLEAHVTIR